MRAVEILMIVSIVMQVVAMVIALFLVNKTKFRALWICCIISLILLSVERYLQLEIFAGEQVSELGFAWVGIIASLSFSICVVCAYLLVKHADRVTEQRRVLENRLLTAVLRTEEQSRASFSRELHDGLGPLLSSAKMSLSALQRASLSENDKAVLQSSSAVIDEAIRSLREISNNLSPRILNDFGLARGIDRFVDRLGVVRQANVEFRSTIGDKRYDRNVEVILYRVVCELINNSIKHAECKQIRLSLAEQGGCLVLDYSDDGKGFDLSEVEDMGMGLSNIRSRVSTLNGKLKIVTYPGAGVRVKVVVPIDGAVVNVESILEQGQNVKRRRNGRRRG